MSPRYSCMYSIICGCCREVYIYMQKGARGLFHGVYTAVMHADIIESTPGHYIQVQFYYCSMKFTKNRYIILLCRGDMALSYIYIKACGATLEYFLQYVVQGAPHTRSPDVARLLGAIIPRRLLGSISILFYKIYPFSFCNACNEYMALLAYITISLSLKVIILPVIYTHTQYRSIYNKDDYYFYLAHC
jgi:hypothetical protein